MMTLTNELKLLLIKTESHKDDAAATTVFNTIRDMAEIDEDDAYAQRLNRFYKRYCEELDLGTSDAEGVWTEPTAAELKVALISKTYVQPVSAAMWELEKYESEAAYTADQYARDRQAVYPKLEDQLDKIFHDGVDAWKADIQAIKDAHPKT